MTFRVDTHKMKAYVTKVVKGAGFISGVGMTFLLGLEVKGNDKLLLRTTDGQNVLQMSVDILEAEGSCNVVIQIDKFSQLIPKMTVDFLTMSIEDDTLVIKGDGTYKIPLVQDADGLVTFPSIDETLLVGAENIKTFDVNSVRSIIKVNKPCLAKSYEIPAVTAYYVSPRKVVATDSMKACQNSLDFLDITTLLSAKTVDLLSLTGCTTIQYVDDESTILFRAEDLLLSATKPEGLSTYPIVALEQLFSDNDRVPYSCVVSKTLFMNALDRLSLFVSSYDGDGVIMTFADNSIVLYTKDSEGSEVIENVEYGSFGESTVVADIKLLQSLISSCAEEGITVRYGTSSPFISFSSDNIQRVLALRKGAK